MSESYPIDELKALAHPVRFKILQVLAQGERNVGDIEELAEIGQPTLSQQLAVLRNAGIVKTRKEAKLVFYRLDQGCLKGIAAVLESFVDQPAVRPETHRSISPGAANFARLT